MSSYFTLVLDTVPPQIEILAPWYTVAGADTHIYVIADEPLDAWQEIYIIDAAGERHDFIFAHQNDRFYGVVKLAQIAVGIATIYARVRDTVHNVSALASKTIDVKEGAQIFVFAAVASRRVDAGTVAQKIAAAEAARAVGASEAARGVGAREAARQIDVEVR